MTSPSSSSATASRDQRAAPKQVSSPKGEASAATPVAVSIHRSYLNRVQAIFAGYRSKPDDLFNPMHRMDTEGYYVVGEVTDLMAREFFSLHYHLKQEMMHLPMPRNADQTRAHVGKVKELSSLAAHATELGWQCVRDLFPDRLSLEHDDMQLIEGWIVIRPKTAEDTLREVLEGRGRTPEQIEREIFALRRREDIEKSSGRESLLEALTGGQGEGLNLIEYLKKLRDSTRE